jgi:PilZ domain
LQTPLVSVEFLSFSQAKVMGDERRRAIRKKVRVEIEILMPDHSVPMRLATADLSCCGCYIENMFTFSVGTNLSITLWIGEERLQIGGVVRTADPGFGNGIEFVGTDPVGQAKLASYLDGFGPSGTQS